MTACIAKSSPEMGLIRLNARQRMKVLHELAPLQLSKSCFPPRAGEGLLFRKMRPKAMRKCGKITLDACDKADDAKYMFPKGGHNQQLHISRWILHNSECNKWCKRVQIGSTGGPKKQSLPQLPPRWAPVPRGETGPTTRSGSHPILLLLRSILSHPCAGRD